MAEYILKKLGWKDSEGRRHIIDFTGKSSTPTFIGPKPGSPGYGTGVYKGDDLEESLGLFLMEGTENPSHDNFGNYRNSDGSIFCFIPKFYYSFNCKPTDAHYNDTLKYSGLSEEQLAQIVTRSPLNYMAFAPGSVFANEVEANQHGFILHRAFIDGGQEKSGFFIAKYLASKGTDGTSDKALFVKNGFTISLSTSINHPSSSAMPGCSGNPKDAIILSKAINPNLNCASVFMYSALTMQSKFIGTIVTSTDQCAWYDPNLIKNFPKGCNNGYLHDFNDSSVTYTYVSDDYQPKTGSGVSFAKTTHNGLNNGVCDLNGCIWQVNTGVGWGGSRVLKDSVRLSDITTDNVDDPSASYYNTASALTVSTVFGRWGNTYSTSWKKSSFGSDRAFEGVYPPSITSGASTGGTSEFGQDYCAAHANYSTNFCSGSWKEDIYSGIFCRSDSNWLFGSDQFGFRSGGYALN